jgi:hypothetical protein
VALVIACARGTPVPSTSPTPLEEDVPSLDRFLGPLATSASPCHLEDWLEGRGQVKPSAVLGGRRMEFNSFELMPQEIRGDRMTSLMKRRTMLFVLRI